MVKMPHWPKYYAPATTSPQDSFNLFRHLLDELEISDKTLPPIIHVAGTNGKGSTIAFLHSILKQEGYRVSIYTSPHLMNFNERIVTSRGMIEDGELYRCAEIVRIKAEELKLDQELSFFALTTAIAFLYFAKTQDEILILETGMGGMFDPTNAIIHKILAIITPISLDHLEFLGESLEEVSRHKAGIIRPDSPLIIAQQENIIATNVMTEIANILKVKTIHARESDIDGGLTGDHQRINLGTAIAALDALKVPFPVTAASIRKGAKSVYWPSRLEQIKPLAWLDGAHNPAGAAAIGHWIASNLLQYDKVYIIVGFTAGKDRSEFFRQLSLNCGKKLEVIALRVPNEPLPESVDKIVDYATQARLNAVPANSMDEAFSIAEEGFPVIVCGSLYLRNQNIFYN